MDNNELVSRLYESLGYRITVIAWQVKENLRKEFLQKGYDITSDQFTVLLRLWQNEGLTQNELSQRTCKNKSNLTRILDGMEKKGLIFRQVSKEDRRSFNIFLSEEGWKLRDKLTSIAGNTDEKVFSGMTDNEKDLLSKILDRISANLFD